MNIDEIKKAHAKKLIEKTVKALCLNGFDAIYADNLDEASKMAMSFIKPGMSVGFGGSVTTDALFLPKKVEDIGARAIVHGKAKDKEERLARMREQQVADVFITGANAISKDGVIYNMDGSGNRVSAMIFGPKQVIIIAGVNKIVSDETAALDRIRNIAAPMNCIRLGYETPCAETGACVNCAVDTRICRAYVQLKKRPVDTPTTVIIIGEELGL